MKIELKLKFEEPLLVELEDISKEETILYTYTDKQLKEMRKVLLNLVDNDELSSEQLEECKKALEIVKNTLYINNKVNIKKLDAYYLRSLSNEEIIKLRNSTIKVLNQHIILYKDSMLPIYSCMIDVSAVALLAIKRELEFRKLNDEMTKSEKRKLRLDLTKWGCKYATTRFN